MTRWQNDKMTRWQNDKMTRWQNDKITNYKITKLQNYKLANEQKWQIDKLTKWQGGKMTRRHNGKITKIQKNGKNERQRLMYRKMERQNEKMLAAMKKTDLVSIATIWQKGLLINCDLTCEKVVVKRQWTSTTFSQFKSQLQRDPFFQIVAIDTRSLSS